MSKRLVIQSFFGDYEVHTGCDLAETVTLIDQSPNVYWLIDSNVAERYHLKFGRLQPNQVFVIDAREANKSLDQVSEICQWMSSNSVSRSSSLVAVGGGVTQDLVAFVASVFHRGLSYSLVPTTLLAMVDSCIGGKSSINVRGAKNIVGTFQGPEKVFISEEFIDTLSTNDIISGLGEVAKFGLLESGNLFDSAVSALRHGSVSMAEARKIVDSSLQIKKPFIEADEFDYGVRRTLNYGHSVGHVIEALTNYEVPHGIAVGIGCHVENLLLRDLGTSSVILNKSTELISAIPQRYLKMSASVSASDVMEKLLKDKKASAGSIKMVAVEDFGRHSIVEVPLDRKMANDCVESLRALV